MVSVKSPMIFQPYWTTANDWTMRNPSADFTNMPAGVTFTSALAHPMSTTIGETVMKFDGNSAAHGGSASVFFINNGHNRSSEPTTPPDHAKRWGHRTSFKLYLGTTAPSSQAVIAERGSNPDWQLCLETDRKLTLKLTNGSALTFASTLSLTVSTWYQIDVWQIFNDSSGAALSAHWWVVQVTSGLGGVLATTTYITGSGSLGGYGVGVSFGEAVARGAGFEFYTCNVWSAWEDADNAAGIIRNDRLDPNGTGRNNTWASNVPTAIDESGTVVPNTSDFDSVSIYTTNLNTYDLVDANYLAAGDTVLAVNISWYWKIDSPVKGGTAQIAFYMDDGVSANVRFNSSSAFGTGWQQQNQATELNVAGTAWALSDVAPLEMGVQAENITAQPNQLISAITTIFVYQKAGETLPALPSPTSKRRVGAII